VCGSKIISLLKLSYLVKFRGKLLEEKFMTEVYQLHLWLRKISPMISRRFLVKGDTSIADLHQIIQVSMGWSGTHLHKFSIQGKEYGVSYKDGNKASPWQATGYLHLE